jgi:hypothetical protein
MTVQKNPSNTPNNSLSVKYKSFEANNLFLPQKINLIFNFETKLIPS